MIIGFNWDKMQLLQRRKEIMKLQSELITEKRMIHNKLDLNIVQKFKLEKRKLEMIRKIQKPLPCPPHNPQLNVTPSPQTNQPVTPPQKSPCTIQPVANRYISPYSTCHPSKVKNQLFKPDEWSMPGLSDDDLLKEINKLDK